MSLLGDSSKPTTSQEWHGSGSNNVHAQILTLPGGGPWNITGLGAWAAGKDASCTAYLCIWSGAGNLIGYSSIFTMGSRSFGLGQSDLYESTNLESADPVVSGGAAVYVGISRNPTGAAQFGTRASGVHDDAINPWVGGYPVGLSANTSHFVGDMGAYLYYSASNAAPNAPTLNDPTWGELVASQTPTLNFTPSDPDGDTHTGYTYQVDNNSDFSSPAESTEVNGSFANGVAVNRVVTSTLARGNVYYYRVKTKDATNGYGPYSGGVAFQIASLPTAVVTRPVNTQPAELYFTAGAAGNPKIRARWSYNCPNGHAQNQMIIRIYADAAGSPGSLLNTDTYNGSGTSFDTTYAVVENTRYHVGVQPKCSFEVQGVESSRVICRTRWARASYFFDSGSVPTTLGAAADVSSGSNQTVVIEYTATGSTTEPTTWYANVSSAGLNRYFWHRVTMFAWGSATPSSPTVNSVTWSYSANAVSLDHWSLSPIASVDLGTFVYGTQSLKHTNDGVFRRTAQQIAVTPYTDMILSAQAKTLGDAAVTIRFDGFDVQGGTTGVPADSDWVRVATGVINTGASTQLQVDLDSSGPAGTIVWFDAVKAEASTVVTPWSPGFIGPATVVDAGGVQVNAQAGGVFRLKGSAGGARDLVDLGPHGLRLGGDIDISTGTSFPASPTNNDQCYRTDIDMWFFYDSNASRWFSTTLYDMVIPLSYALLPFSVTQPFGQAAALPFANQFNIWFYGMRVIYYIGGGPALDASNKWFLRALVAPGGGEFGTHMIDSGATSVWRDSGLWGTPGLVPTGSNKVIYMEVNKTGTVGPIDLLTTMQYRISS